MRKRTQHEVLAEAAQILERWHTRARSLRDRAASQPVSVLEIEALTVQLVQDAPALRKIANRERGAVNQLANGFDKPPPDFHKMLNDALTTGQALIDWIAEALPAHQGFHLVASFDPALGRFTYRELTVSQTEGLRTRLDAFVSTLP